MQPPFQLFKIALSLALDMGPHTRAPLASRLFRKAWWTSRASRQAALVMVKEALDYAYELGTDVRDKRRTDTSALLAIRSRYPNLDEELAFRLRAHGYLTASK